MSYIKLEENTSISFDAERLKTFKGKHAGKRCFIIGNGPSLNKIDLSKLNDEITFGVNGIFYKTRETGFVPTYYVVEDDHVLRDNCATIEDYKVQYKFFPSMHRSFVSASTNTFFFLYNRGFFEKKSPNYQIPRFSTDISDKIYGGQTVTYTNLQLAYYMGFVEVYLIGIDFSYQIPTSAIVDGVNITSTEDDPNHFHPDYFGKGKKWHNPKLDQVIKNYEFANHIYRWNGRKIFNATVGGKLEVFDRVEFNTLFNDSREIVMKKRETLKDERSFPKAKSGEYTNIHSKVKSPFPVSGSIEITTVIGCRISCKACPQSLLLKKYKKLRLSNGAKIPPTIEMSLEHFKQMLRKVPQKVRVDFSGFSEPFLNKSCADMILFAASKGHEVTLFTTLVGMSFDDIEKLSSITLDWLYLHIPDVEKNSKIPYDSNYKKLFMRVLDTGLKYRKISFSCHGTVHPEIAAILDAHPRFKDTSFATTLLDRAGNISEIDGVGLKHYSHSGYISCVAAGNQLNQNVLLPNGNMVMCCQDYGLKHSFGNLLNDDYYDIFKGKEYKKVRSGLKDDSIDILCRTCARAVKRNIPKVSVIVPIYNVEKYLKKCLKSLIGQTLKDIEIIIINDGSTDGSLELAEKYASKDKRLEIINQNNKGLGGARNSGIEAAKGEYLFFLDGDDFIKSESLKSLYDYAKEKQVDIVVFNYIKIDEDGKIIASPNFGDKVIAKEEAFLEALSFKISPASTNKMYKKELFIHNEIRYRENFLHEDIPVTYKLFWYANKVGYMPKSYYFWLQRSDSITQKFSKEHINDVMTGLLDIRVFLKNKGLFQKYKNEHYKACFSMLTVLLNRAVFFSNHSKNFISYLLHKIDGVGLFNELDFDTFAKYDEKTLTMYEMGKKTALIELQKLVKTHNSNCDLRKPLTDSVNMTLIPHLKNKLLIVGNGSSLRDFDFKWLLNVKFLGMNAAFRYWKLTEIYPDYYICMDTIVIASLKDEIYKLIQKRAENGIQLFFIRKKLLNFYPELNNVPEVTFFEDYFNSPYFEGITQGITTGSFAALLGAMLGYKHIYLLGIDLNYVQQIPEAKSVKGHVLEITETPAKNPNYFFDDYQRKGDRFNVPDSKPDLHYQSWVMVKERLERFGVHVLNCNPNSRLDIFDYADINEVLPR